MSNCSEIGRNFGRFSPKMANFHKNAFFRKTGFFASPPRKIQLLGWNLDTMLRKMRGTNQLKRIFDFFAYFLDLFPSSFCTLCPNFSPIAVFSAEEMRKDWFSGKCIFVKIGHFWRKTAKFSPDFAKIWSFWVFIPSSPWSPLCLWFSASLTQFRWKYDPKSLKIGLFWTPKFPN